MLTQHNRGVGVIYVSDSSDLSWTHLDQGGRSYDLRLRSRDPPDMYPHSLSPYPSLNLVPYPVSSRICESSSRHASNPTPVHKLG